MLLKEGINTKAFAAAEKELKSYAAKNGGIDKKDFMDVAKMLGQISRVNILQAGQVLGQLNRKVQGMDTDPRDKVFEILKKQGLYESAESVQEKMTEKQMKKREEIVKSMKKNQDDFEDRYGDRAKDVMYATATKMVMDEDIERRADVKMVKVRLPDGTMVMRRQRPEVKIGDTRTENSVRTEEKDTHKTKDGRTAKKGLYYYINKKKEEGRKANPPGHEDRPTQDDFKAAEKTAKEEVQQFDELSPATHKSYQAKAFSNAALGMAKKRMGTMSSKDAYDNEKKRYKGIDTSKHLNRMHHGVLGDEVIHEGVIDDLRNIVKRKSAMDVKFSTGNKTRVDMFTASAMVKVHDALNGQNQKKFADAINKDERMFMKMLDFAMSKVK